jgi:pimeloyl-ACP methyl ester carboxylesterase
MARNPIVFIHGLWMHSSTWQPWMQFFNQHGYDCFNPDWPGDGATVEQSRANGEAIANHSIKQVADGYAKSISALSSKPIMIGHSFGGLMVQILLDRGLAAAGIAINPAPIKGVWQLPFSAIKSSLPVLGNPFNLKKSVSLSHKQFRYAFTNAISEEESRELYERYTVPSPARPLFQVAFATLNPKAESKVNVTNSSRGPLLITSGEKDHIVPPVLCQATLNRYKKSTAVTELKSFANRGHSIALDHGWQEVAEYSLKWLNERGL